MKLQYCVSSDLMSVYCTATDEAHMVLHRCWSPNDWLLPHL